MTEFGLKQKVWNTCKKPLRIKKSDLLHPAQVETTQGIFASESAELVCNDFVKHH